MCFDLRLHQARRADPSTGRDRPHRRGGGVSQCKWLVKLLTSSENVDMFSYDSLSLISQGYIIVGANLHFRTGLREIIEGKMSGETDNSI